MNCLPHRQIIDEIDRNIDIQIDTYICMYTLRVISSCECDLISRTILMQHLCTLDHGTSTLNEIVDYHYVLALHFSFLQLHRPLSSFSNFMTDDVGVLWKPPRETLKRACQWCVLVSVLCTVHNVLGKERGIFQPTKRCEYFVEACGDVDLGVWT